MIRVMGRRSEGEGSEVEGVVLKWFRCFSCEYYVLCLSSRYRAVSPSRCPSCYILSYISRDCSTAPRRSRQTGGGKK